MNDGGADGHLRSVDYFWLLASLTDQTWTIGTSKRHSNRPSGREGDGLVMPITVAEMGQMKHEVVLPSLFSVPLFPLRSLLHSLLANCVRARVGQSKNLSGLHSSSLPPSQPTAQPARLTLRWLADPFSQKRERGRSTLAHSQRSPQMPGEKVAPDEIARQRKLRSPFRFPLFCRVQPQPASLARRKLARFCCCFSCCEEMQRLHAHL